MRGGVSRRSDRYSHGGVRHREQRCATPPSVSARQSTDRDQILVVLMKRSDLLTQFLDIPVAKLEFFTSLFEFLPSVLHLKVGGPSFRGAVEAFIKVKTLGACKCA